MEAPSPEDKRLADLEKARELINNVKEKSDDDYEKSVSLISTGTLVLSLTFIEKIVDLPKSTHKGLLVASWVFMGLTLIINLVSHQLSSYFSELLSEALVYEDPKLIINFRKRNKIIRVINMITTSTLFVGMVFLISFCSLNAVNMSKKIQEVPSRNAPVKQPVKNNEERGRTNQIPTSVLEAAKPKVTSQPGGSTGQSDTDKTK